MNIQTTILPVLCLLGLFSCNSTKTGRTFDTTNQDNWQTTGSVTLKDSLLTISGTDSRAIMKCRTYQDFDLQMQVLTTPGAKGSIGIHTDDSGKGYQIAINNDSNDPVWWKKTGSLLSVRNLTKSLATDNEWFDMHIRVEGQAITVHINGQPVVEYIEPADPLRLPPNDRALLSDGVFSFISQGQGRIQVKNIVINPLDRKGINIPAQFAVARDERNDDVIRLHQENFPVLDYHVHFKGGFTRESAAKQSRKTGVNYAIAPNCGIGFPITNDEQVYDFLESMRKEPFILAMQAEGREWVTTFSQEARDGFDFVFTDALTFNDHKGRRTRLWINKQVIIDDEQQYMDMIVDRMCGVLQEPADVFVNPFFLPEAMNDRYDEFWTDDRVDKVIGVLTVSGMALEINELYNIPSKAIIMKAKDAGVKFTFGSNNISPEAGRLEYSIRMKKECGLTPGDMYRPGEKK